MSAPADPRADRQRALVRFLRVATALTLVLAAGALVPGAVGRVSRGGMLAVLLATPLVRALWLAVRWATKDDARYALVASAVVAISTAGALLA